MTDTLALMLRVGLSFTFVLGLMWFAARVFRGKLGSRGAGVLEVLARQQVGRGASVAIVRVADRAMVVGVTEHGVSMLGEPIGDLELFAGTAEVAGTATNELATTGLVTSRRGITASGTPAMRPSGEKSRLNGSILSPSTWRQALHILRERTVRR